MNDVTMDRVQKARTELILSRKFYGVMVMNIEPVVSSKIETAGTNGKQHFWNPSFVAELTQLELLGVQAHESEHDARHHSTRRGNRDHELWNAACDYSINGDLLAEGFVLPKGRLYDPRFNGMSAEDIYRTLELEQKKPQQPPPPPPQDGDDEEEGEDGLDGADTNPGNGSESCDDSQDADDAEENATDGADGEAEKKSEKSEPGKGAGKGAGEPDGDAEGEGQGEGGDAPGKAGTGGEGTNNGQEDGQSVPSGTGDVGRCGEVLDAAPEANERAEEDIKWEKIVRQAVSMAKAAGQLPGHITREIERLNNPPRDWRDELREFCEQGSLKIETWNRPNRRFVSQGLTLPGSQRDGVNKAAFLIDTSGSMDDIALACVRDEAQQLLDDGIINEIVVIYGDTTVTRVDEYMTGDEIVFDPRGGGGTDMKPLFDHVAEMFSDVSLIINFTDLEFYSDLGEEPAVPVLFAVHGFPNRVQYRMSNPPWGARCIDVGAH